VIPNLHLTRLHVLVAVVEHGGIGRAAFALNMAQPTVSFHIRELERTFGTKLVTSRGSPVTLSESGEVVYQLGKRILADAEAMSDRVDALVRGEAGRLKVGLSLSLEGARTYTSIMQPFLARYPRAHVSIRFGLSGFLCEQVAARELDLAYLVLLVPHPELVSEPLHEEELLLLVSPAHPLAKRKTIAPQDLANTSFIVPSRGEARQDEYEAVTRQWGLPSSTSSVEVDSGEGWVQAARAGIGVATVYRPAAEDEIRSGTLVPLPVETRSGTFGLVYRPDAHWSPLMKGFADQVRSAVTSRAN
jgi:DNA-binding transcriptional LysR family regulator